jgi:hypothetical protein
MLKLSIERVGAMASLPVPTLNPRVEVWRDNEGVISAYGEVLDEEYRMHLPGLATFRFTSDGEAIAASVANGTRDELVVDAYFRKVLPMVLQVRGREVLHASAVHFPAGVVALCGVSETGKSTIAFGLSQRGYSLWADDSVALQITDSGVLALSLPFNIRLRPSSAELFDYDVHATPFIGNDHKQSLGWKREPLSAVCVLRRASKAGSPIAVRRLSSAEAFATVLTHAHCFTFEDAERKRRMMDHYLDIVARIPIFDICFPSGLENLSAILDTLERVCEENAPADATATAASEPCLIR